MKNMYLIAGLLFLIPIIIVIGCVTPYDVGQPIHSTPPSNTANPTVSPTNSRPVDPAQLLSAPTWNWNNRVRIKEVDISNNGDYVGGLSTSKVVIKTPTKNLLSNLVWKNAQWIDISDSGNYIAVSDRYFVNLYDREGGQLYSHSSGGLINGIKIMDNGVLYQGGEMIPQVSALDINEHELWNWKSSLTMVKVLAIDQSMNADNFVLGTDDNKVYYLDNGGYQHWSQDLNGDVIDVEISDNGEWVYALTAKNWLYSLDKYGTKRWSRELDTNTNGIEITGDGSYLITKPYNKDNSNSFKYKVYLFERDGYVKWTKQYSNEGAYSLSKNPKYVVTTDGRYLRMYNLNGDELASYYLDGQYGSFFVSLAMTPDANKLVAGTTNHMLVFG